MGSPKCGHDKISVDSPQVLLCGSQQPPRLPPGVSSPAASGGEAFSGAENSRPGVEDSLGSVRPSIKELESGGEMGNIG